MGGLPVAINKNLDRSSQQLPVAGSGESPLGGVKVDGITITIDPATGIISATAGGGNVIGTGTTKKLPIWTAAHTLGDSPIEYDLTFAGAVYIVPPLKVGGDVDLFGNLTLDNGILLLSDAHSSVEATLYIAHNIYNAATFPLPILGSAPARAFVSDALTQTFNDAYGAGGGAFTMPVFWNGVAWFIG